MSVKTIFTALAEQVRRLSGRTGNLGVEAMTDALSGVKIGVDASGLTASASDVIGDKTFIGSSGGTQTGTMVNNGAVSATLDSTTKSYTVPAGYHNGSGKVQVVTQTKSVTPNEQEQTVYPDEGKLLSAVTVKPGVYTGVYTGTIVVPEDTTDTLTLSVGVTPNENDLFFMYRDEDRYELDVDYDVVVRLSPTETYMYDYYDNSVAKNTHVTVHYIAQMVSIFPSDTFSERVFSPGVSYRWFLVRK